MTNEQLELVADIENAEIFLGALQVLNQKYALKKGEAFNSTREALLRFTFDQHELLCKQRDRILGF